MKASFCSKGPLPKIDPFLRASVDVRALLRGIKRGLIRIVAADHAPHLPTKKAAGNEDI